MNHRRMVMLAAILIGGICFAQPDTATSTDDFKPASTNQSGKQFPQVNSERRVRARVDVPDADNVLLDIGGVQYPLKKGPDGAWVGDSRPQDEGFHYYQLIINSARVSDPGSMYFYGARRWDSGVEVPVQDRDFYALKKCNCSMG